MTVPKFPHLRSNKVGSGAVEHLLLDLLGSDPHSLGHVAQSRLELGQGDLSLSLLFRLGKDDVAVRACQTLACR